MRRSIILLMVMAIALVLGSGVALAAVKFGTEGRDRIVGTNAKDVLYGKGGNDRLAGRGANDVLYGGNGHDVMYGGYVRFGEMFNGRRLVPDGRLAPDGQDKLFGGKGNDCMFGGSENDILYGGPGNDIIGTYCYTDTLDAGKDIMYGGSGNDMIVAIDHTWNASKQQRDTVFCGSGKDTVYYVKGIDSTFGCEQKFDVVEEGGF